MTKDKFNAFLEQTYGRLLGTAYKIDRFEGNELLHSTVEMLLARKSYEGVKITTEEPFIRWFAAILRQVKAYDRRKELKRKFITLIHEKRYTHGEAWQELAPNMLYTKFLKAMGIAIV